ncbi:hypothetical protein [Klebsiella oxytoca]|uniref:hypothetical protein n=1 Tax=Klebsiella oxytoca TaxID=571 RepID=UPI0025934B84|nr:hypothetical protein [Klebsiella oxytoca]MDM4157336.1 hypothetical protein [Klebsiella oxytoca]MDM4190627.1 hypothetical protein [Klebsiella oxytoca]MDM4224017.1 hypothetical protein [Klebsiella oxytoca]MDM4238152.1 hypothetical protein [Klebsiella oxytoca]MDM4334610.1 hypothetical protein [Klebsiella oxytoca]
MREFKGTPGHWHVMRGDVLDKNGRMVASIEGFCHGENEIYDAQLIASAPELLEALDKLVTEYIFTRGQLNGDEPDEMEDILCVKNARRAIAKALGK